VTGTAATGGSQVITIANTSTTPSTGGTPFNTTGGPPPSGGKVRIKTASVTGTFTLTSVIVQDSGGNSTQVAGPLGAATAGNIDEVFDFWTDVQITKVIVTGATSTAVGTIDVEVSLV
jgi:hypothetical protein